MFFYEKNDVYKNNINLVNCFGKRVIKKQNKTSVTYSNLNRESGTESEEN